MSVRNIIVIDDDPVSLEMLCCSIEVLPRVKYVAFTDSFEAYQYFHHASPNDIDMVISDWKMPMLDGLELFNVIKSKFPAAPYLLVTAALSSEAADTITGLGMDGLISKPFRTSLITEKVQELLNIPQIA